MNAIRKIIEVKDHQLHIQLPEDFDAQTAEVIIFPNRDENFFVPDFYYEELNERREKHLNGKSKSYTWEEIKSKLTTHRKNV